MNDFLIKMVNEVCGGGIFSSIYDTLALDLFAGDYEDVWLTVKDLAEQAIQSAALWILLIYFMVALIDKLSSENFTWEQFWRLMAMFLASKYLMEKGPELLETMFHIGMALASEIETVTGFDPGGAGEIDEAEALIASFKASLGVSEWPEILGDLVMVFFLIIPWLAAQVMKICVNIICYSRIIEIYLRCIFNPFAVADFFHGGMQSNGWRYLKTFLAISLQGAMILAIAVVFDALSDMLVADADDLFAFTGVYLAFSASGIMLMFKSLSLSKEIVGVN